MKKKFFIMEDLYKTGNFSKKLSIFDEYDKQFLPIYQPQRSNSDPTSIIIQNQNNFYNIFTKKISNIGPKINPINQIQNEDSQDFNEKDKINLISQNIPNTNFYGFKGRSPYVNINQNSNNNLNYNNKIITNDKKSIKNNINISNINSSILNQNEGPQRINGFILSELKDKVLDYRCSVCDFVCFERDELRKHLAIKKHFTFPRKLKKGKKHIVKNKNFYKNENKNNQSYYMYTLMKQNKKNYDKKLVCRHCSKKFDSKYALNSHLNAHKFKCDICYKLFNNKEDLINHKHSEKISQECFESLYDIKKSNKHMKKEYKSPTKKMEIDDWEDVSSNKKDKWESDDEINKNDDFEKSYAFIEDSDENFDFNKMVKVNDNII